MIDVTTMYVGLESPVALFLTISFIGILAHFLNGSDYSWGIFVYALVFTIGLVVVLGLISPQLYKVTYHNMSDGEFPNGDSISVDVGFYGRTVSTDSFISDLKNRINKADVNITYTGYSYEWSNQIMIYDWIAGPFYIAIIIFAFTYQNSVNRARLAQENEVRIRHEDEERARARSSSPPDQSLSNGIPEQEDEHHSRWDKIEI